MPIKGGIESDMLFEIEDCEEEEMKLSVEERPIKLMVEPVSSPPLRLTDILASETDDLVTIKNTGDYKDFLMNNRGLSDISKFDSKMMININSSATPSGGPFTSERNQTTGRDYSSLEMVGEEVSAIQIED